MWAQPMSFLTPVHHCLWITRGELTGRMDSSTSLACCFFRFLSHVSPLDYPPGSCSLLNWHLTSCGAAKTKSPLKSEMKEQEESCPKLGNQPGYRASRLPQGLFFPSLGLLMKTFFPGGCPLGVAQIFPGLFCILDSQSLGISTSARLSTAMTQRLGSAVLCRNKNPWSFVTWVLEWN